MTQSSRSVSVLDVLVAIASLAALYQCCELLYLCLPGDRVLPDLLWGAGIAVSFAAAVVTVFWIRLYWRRAGAELSSAVMRRRPILARVVLALVAGMCVTMLVVAASTAPNLPDAFSQQQPVFQDGQYFLASHGGLTPISKVEYLEARRASQQSFMALLLGFYLVSLVAFGVADGRTKRVRGSGADMSV